MRRHPNRAFALASAAFALAFFGAPLGASGKSSQKPIEGRLSKPGYTVIAMAASGAAKSTVARHGRFRLRPPAASVTLQLRAPNGTYAGPVVLGRAPGAKKGKGHKPKRRVIVGVRAGAKLGKIELHPGKGYAKVKRAAKRYVDSHLLALATKRWAPIGNALNVGLVRSRAHGSNGDSDLDGVPNPIDVDDNGNLILDDYDSANAGPGAAAHRSLESSLRPPFMSLMTRLWVGGEANVDGGSSEEQIAAAEREYSQLAVLWGGVDEGSAELDCGKLVYCSAGGSGRYVPHGGARLSESLPFPECCDADADGLGSLVDTPPSDAAHDFHGMALYTGATDEQMRAGDVLIERATRNEAPVEFVSSLGFVFSTYPALASYDDGQGDSATFTYPRPSKQPLPVRAGPNGDVVLRLTFWRPQRRRLVGEPGEGRWMDVGNLDYTTSIPPPPSVNPPTPVVETVPNGAAKPKAPVAWSTSPSVVPPPTRAVRASGSTCT